MTFKEDIWGWLKTAPLPVVLAVVLLSTGSLAVWVWAVEKDQDTNSETIAAIDERSKANQATVAKIDDKVDEGNELLRQILVTVTEVKTKQEIVAAELAAEKKKKENN